MSKLTIWRLHFFIFWKSWQFLLAQCWTFITFLPFRFSVKSILTKSRFSKMSHLTLLEVLIFRFWENLVTSKGWNFQITKFRAHRIVKMYLFETAPVKNWFHVKSFCQKKSYTFLHCVSRTSRHVSS